MLGPTAIQDQHPHDRPKRSKKSPTPFFHAFTKSARKLFQEAYSRFLVAFREAAESLKAGDLTAPFPVGCFPPGLPFVTASPSSRDSLEGSAEAWVRDLSLSAPGKRDLVKTHGI